eukprot:CAMPEP_0206479892 /NCGR_PEP_ID=MMETSP0324_2-20121206/36934_1 /ASSEMBLY_ACC=CAM_ASM_000836 /TAXON_ID=2866 /ORGANISM="Crypthecodinium cohnii, Strain Seligo" /LENGTH=135 /DNA_ID=CAMNT_0053956505 /DNA_START=233 /DNA_END=640 /DNA_ORIENTATION=-
MSVTRLCHKPPMSGERLEAHGAAAAAAAAEAAGNAGTADADADADEGEEIADVAGPAAAAEGIAEFGFVGSGIRDGDGFVGSGMCAPEAPMRLGFPRSTQAGKSDSEVGLPLTTIMLPSPSTTSASGLLCTCLRL